MLSRKAKVQEEKHRLRELRANQVRVYSITQIPATAPQSILLFSFFLFSFFLLGLHSWHMQVPRLGVKSELKLPA